MDVDVDVAVIGAGQAGLSAAYHLRRRGFESPGPATRRGAQSAVALDAEDGPGGAWRHRWDSLTMAGVNGIHDLPGMDQPEPDPDTPANRALPAYFADFEHQFGLEVHRPLRVRRVSRLDSTPRGRLLIEAEPSDGAPTGPPDARPARRWRARTVINATGTWNSPLWPSYPGRETFLGRQLHTADYRGPQEFLGQRVLVVGAGVSAVQHLHEISRVTDTIWTTRREPVFREVSFSPELGREAVAMVEERVRAGLPPRSVVSATGLVWTPELRAAARQGVLDRLPMFARIEPTGVRWSDGTFRAVEVILWATGFRSHLPHLAPLHLRGPGGGIRMDGTAVADEPRVHMIGYGPSSSTVGANRAGREAVVRLERYLRAHGSMIVKLPSRRSS